MTNSYKPPANNGDQYAEYDLSHLFEDDTPKVDPAKVVEVVPGTSYTGDLFKHTVHPNQRRLWHMNKDDERLAKYTRDVQGWLAESEGEAAVGLSSLMAPRIDRAVVPSVRQEELDLFRPRERRRRSSDAIAYTTEKFIDALGVGSEGQESFVKKMLPPDVNIGEAIVIFDKDQRYREVAAAACYRVLEQLANDGMLDSYERVKLNRDYKTVAHGDAAIKRGRNRDVVVGMTLDMLSGRFNAKENWETSKALNDGDRDSRGVFRGGHHSGAAYQVARILTDPASYEMYFGSNVTSPEEELRSELEDLNFLESMKSIEPVFDSTEVRMYDQLPNQIKAHGQGFEFSAEHYSEVVLDPGDTTRPISIKRGVEIDEMGEPIRGLVVRDVARAEAIRLAILARAGGRGVQIEGEQLVDLVTHFSRIAGAEKFIAENVGITFGRSPDCTLQLLNAGNLVSRHHAICSMDPSGKIYVQDTSTNGSMLRYR